MLVFDQGNGAWAGSYYEEANDEKPFVKVYP